VIERALVVGLGSIGVRHLRLLREALPHADIRVLRHSGCDGDIPNADGCFAQLADAAEFAPQIAVLANPAPFHVATARELAIVGTHLLIEKPLAETVANVRGLLDLCRDKAVLLQVGYNLRFLETLQRFRAELKNGRIGDVCMVRCEIGQYLPDWRPNADYRQSVSSRRSLGGGALLELSHELDMLHWVFGSVDWVGAWTGQLGKLEIDVEDSANLTLGFASGAVGQLAMDFLRRDTTRQCVAIGDRGSLRWDAVAGTVTVFDPDAGAWQDVAAVRPERDSTYRLQLSRFLTAVAAGSSDAVSATGEDGLAVLAIIEAARESAKRDGQRTAVARVQA
jgi:predicted dehydrogenase